MLLAPWLDRTSVRLMPWLISVFSTMFSRSIGLVNSASLGCQIIDRSNSGSDQTPRHINARLFVVPISDSG